MGKDDGLDTLSNKISNGLKEDFDRGNAGCDYKKKTVLSAMISNGLTEEVDEQGRSKVVIDTEKLGEELERFSEVYD